MSKHTSNYCGGTTFTDNGRASCQIHKKDPAGQERTSKEQTQVLVPSGLSFGGVKEMKWVPSSK